MVTALLMVGLWGAPQAQGQEMARTMLRQALLTEAMDGDYDAAIQRYQTLVQELPQGHAVRAEALYRLGAARYALGDLRGARDAVMEGIRSGSCRAPCHSLLGEMQLEAESVRTLPVLWDFSTDDHSIFHPWAFDDKGSIRVQSSPEIDNPALIWTTDVDVRKGDQLVVGFKDLSPPPEVITVRMQADPNPAALRVRVVDNDGRTYTRADGLYRITVDRPTTVRVLLSELTPDTPTDPPLDPSAIHRVYIEDFSAFNGTPPGPNQLYLDDFRVE